MAQDILQSEKDHIKELIEIGEYAKQKEDQIEHIEITYNESDVTELILNWMEEFKVRTPSSIQDLFDLLDEYVELQAKNAKKLDKQGRLKRKSLKSGDYYRKYLTSRRKIFDDIIKQQQEKLGKNWIPPELDALVAADLIYARNIIVEEANKLKQTLNSIKIKSRHFNYHVRHTIYEKTKFAIFSILLVNLRLMEISIASRKGSDFGKLFELLEWDLNTLQFTRYNLDEYAGSLLKKVWNKEWTMAFTEETRELIKLFK